MPDSQSQTPGDSFAISERARLETLILRAADLEQQLANLKKSDEQTAAGLRSHLCEVLSDVIISDPALSWENDCAGKLWRSCFYAPIVVWRKKLSREKKRQGSTVKSLEQNFKRFLSEALTLYDYLVVQYQSKILSTTTSRGNLGEQSQLSAVSSIEAVDTVDPVEGVVPGLFRLFIHMGDLHRYDGSFSKAETYYLCASRLAPGMGNPYNQLAVVSQLKDPNLSCVALYWYCRSLLATHDSFETSSSNLERLFDMNRTYLKEHSRTAAPPIFSQTQATKKMSSDMIRAEKAAATKACLAHFVDLHYDLFTEYTSEPSKDALLQSKMDGVIRSLESLLHASAFGDSLLLKMVLINTFSVERAKASPATFKLQVATDFFWRFGQILLERLNTCLALVVEKSGKQPNTIRVLQPLLIQLEYIRHDVGAIQMTSNGDFWRSLTAAATNMRQLYNVSEISEVKSESELAELSILKGYKPFNALNVSYRTGSPFIGASDAAFVLDLQATQSQPSSKQKDENYSRVVHFIKVSGSISNSFNHDQRGTAAVPDFSANEGCSDVAAITNVASYSDEGGDLVIDIHPDQQPMVEPRPVGMTAPILDSSSARSAILRDDQEHSNADSSFTVKPIRPPPGFEVATGFPVSAILPAGSIVVPVHPEQPSRSNCLPMGAGSEEYANDSTLIVRDSTGQNQSFDYGERFVAPALSETFLNASIPFSNNPFYNRVSEVSSLAPDAQNYTFSTFHDNTHLSNLSWLEGIWEDHGKTKTQNPFANQG